MPDLTGDSYPHKMYSDIAMMTKTQRDTPVKVAHMLYELSGISGEDSLLEPSAGSGTLLDYIRSIYPKKTSMKAYELNAEKVAILKEKGYDAEQADFLLVEPSADYTKYYDRIIAAPPFKDNVDLLHIMHMFRFLKWSGCLAALTSPYWLTNNEKHQVLFREWLESKKYDMRMLPDNTFIEKGRTVPTAIIRIWK